MTALQTDAVSKEVLTQDSVVSALEQFELVQVVDESGLHEFGRLALDVYGLERRYERVASGQEFFLDTFDTAASGNTLHYLVKDRRSNIFLAGVRVIAVRGSKQNAPFFAECESVNLPIPQEILNELDGLVEVSRFCISRKRRRKAKVSSEEEILNIQRFLVAAIMRISKVFGATFYASFCDTMLRENLSKMHVNWAELSASVDYNGRPRQLAGGNVVSIHEVILENEPLIRKLVDS